MSDFQIIAVACVGLCAIAVGAVALLFSGPHNGRLPKMEPAPPYEKPEDRPKPVMPPRLHCTNCGHGHNIIDLTNWGGGPL